MVSLNKYIGIFECLNCDSGWQFDGVMMHGNPSSYSDYDECWSPCGTCGGSGQVLMLPIKYSWRKIRYWFKHRKARWVEEAEIPF